MQPPPNEGQPASPQQPYYPPQYGPPPYQQPPMYQPPPKKKRKRWPFVLLGILILLCAIVGIAVATSSGGSPSITNSSPTATTVPTAQASTPNSQPKWTTVQKFSGSGIHKTAIFSVPGDWKLTWSCKPSSFYGSQYNVQVYVYNSDGSIADVAINELCKAGNTSGETEEHQSGNIYLDINSESQWTVSVQVLK